jgi:PD-(D/E)XK nuclease family transposase
MTSLEQTKLPVFIPFTSDYGFKVTFGNEENTVFLRRAIPALTQSLKPIAKIFFDKTVYSGLTESGKSGIFDLACTDEVRI